MLSVEKCPVPAHTMLATYSRPGVYVDCYRTEVPGQRSLREFILAFYTTGLFRLERAILKLMASKPSTDIQLRQLADATRQEFAAWRVEGRNEREILLCDFLGRTRSWLMTVSSGPGTQLYFGSAVVPKQDPRTGKLTLGGGYQALLGFHRVYSVLLLYSARVSLQRTGHPWKR